jgi:hypothetical protein
VVTASLLPLGRIFSSLSVRAGDDMYGHELADAPCLGRPGVCRSVHGADVAADHHGHVAGADVFLANKLTSAVFTIASAASTAPVSPLVSIIPKASNGMRRELYRLQRMPAGR